MRSSHERLTRLAPILLALLAASALALFADHPLPRRTEPLILGVILGALARLARHRGWVHTARALAGLAACAAVGFVAAEVETMTVGMVLLSAASLPVMIAALTWKRNLAAFAVGAAFAAIMLRWFASAQGTLAICAFLFARDAGAIDRDVPGRQTIAIAGAGAFAILMAQCLAFDLSATVGVAENGFCEIGLDDAWSRYPRMVVEAATIVASCALARGRTWSLFALPALGVGLLLWVLWLDLPGWRCGCTITIHPLDRSVLAGGLLVALAPWARPLWTHLGRVRRR